MLTVQPPVEPRPLHNEDGTLRALARQMLQDLDETRETTPVPTATLKLLLSRLCDALADTGKLAGQITAARGGGLLETAANPNLAYWQRRSEADEDAASTEEP